MSPFLSRRLRNTYTGWSCAGTKVEVALRETNFVFQHRRSSISYGSIFTEVSKAVLLPEVQNSFRIYILFIEI